MLFVKAGTGARELFHAAEPIVSVADFSAASVIVSPARVPTLPADVVAALDCGHVNRLTVNQQSVHAPECSA